MFWAPPPEPTLGVGETTDGAELASPDPTMMYMVSGRAQAGTSQTALAPDPPPPPPLPVAADCPAPPGPPAPRTKNRTILAPRGFCQV